MPACARAWAGGAWRRPAPRRRARTAAAVARRAVDGQRGRAARSAAGRPLPARIRSVTWKTGSAGAQRAARTPSSAVAPAADRAQHQPFRLAEAIGGPGQVAQVPAQRRGQEGQRQPAPRQRIQHPRIGAAKPAQASAAADLQLGQRRRQQRREFASGTAPGSSRRHRPASATAGRAAAASPPAATARGSAPPGPRGRARTTDAPPHTGAAPAARRIRGRAAAAPPPRRCPLAARRARPQAEPGSRSPSSRAGPWQTGSEKQR